MSVLKKLIFFLLFLPVAAMGQYRITGKVVDIVTKKPVANASVFLSNASAGAKTNDDGTFTINNVRGGQYTLIVSIIGYATYSQSILVNKDIALPEMDIAQQSIVLKEVRIGPDPHWERHYEEFKRDFLGNGDNAKDCTILNPHVLDFDAVKDSLTATAQDFLIIENKALGYRIKYMLSAFDHDYMSGKLYFAGAAFFEDLKGSERQIKKWHERRLKTYLGSDMHFLRSVIANRVKEEGFKVERLIRKPNPDYGKGPGAKYIETLVTTPLGRGEYTKLTDQKDEYALEFKDFLYVIYDNSPLAGSTINIDAADAFFDNNGIILNPESVTMEGSWGESRMPEMLPVDYEPAEK